MPPLAFTIVLAMAAALGPFAIDTYLSAFPSITHAMRVGIDDVGLSVSLYVFGLALGRLVGGSLSDRYGRARVMLRGSCRLYNWAGASETPRRGLTWLGPLSFAMAR